MELDKKNNTIKYTQNFLINKHLVEELINKTDISSQDFLIEIGPGKGILTEALKKKAKNVLAIEKDDKLFLNLFNKYKNCKNVEIIHKDFLEYKLPQKKFKIFSNIPFNITAQIFDKIINCCFFEKGYLIVQKEYAEKICGYPYSHKNQKESLIIKYNFDLKVLYEFKREDFFPKPSVDVVLLCLSRKTIKNAKEKDEYFNFISYIFLQGKKNIKESLKHIFTLEQLKRLSSKYSFNINSKPTEINFETWINIFNYYAIGVEDKKKILTMNSFKKLKQTSKKIKKIHRTRLKGVKWFIF